MGFNYIYKFQLFAIFIHPANKDRHYKQARRLSLAGDGMVSKKKKSVFSNGCLVRETSLQHVLQGFGSGWC
jgi:hypothetical protein